MGVKIGEITSDRTTVPVPVSEAEGAPVVNVVYDPGRYTVELEEEFERISSTQFQSKAAPLFISRLISEWDLLEDDGVTPVPLTEERLRTVPVVFLAKVIQTLRDHNRPTSEEGKDSSAGSPPMEQLANRRDGTESDKQPDSGESLPGSLSSSTSPGSI